MKCNYPLTKKYLGRVWEAQGKEGRLEYRKANLQMMLTDTAVHWSDTPRSSSPDMQRKQTIQAEIDAVEQEIVEARQETEKIREEIGMTICRLSNPLSQRVLILHYLQHMSWRQAAREMQICKATVYRLRDAGYKELEELLKAAQTD